MEGDERELGRKRTREVPRGKGERREKRSGREREGEKRIRRIGKGTEKAELCLVEVSQPEMPTTKFIHVRRYKM
jgi:hypothetical protein